MAADLAKKKRQRDLRKRVIIDGYGGKCVCCGETRYEFLTLDHPERNGYHDRKVNKNWSSTLYRKLIKQGFPKTFRLLCFNCNWSTGIYGYCPHERERAVEKFVAENPGMKAYVEMLDTMPPSHVAPFAIKIPID